MLIKIDTDKMQTVVNNLNDRADDIDAARRDINSSSFLNHDPVPEVSEATELSTFASTSYSQNSLTNLHACAQAVSNLAAELAARRQEAIDISSSGGSFDGGVLGYYLPDPPEDTLDTDMYWQSMDTVANVKAYNSGAIAQAKKDAQAAQQGSRHKLLDLAGGQVFRNQDNPFYATAFADALGPQGMAMFAYNIRQAWEDWAGANAALRSDPPDEQWVQQERLYLRGQSAASVLLGTATTSGLWGKAHLQQYAEGLARLAVDEKAPACGSYALNLLLSGVDHSVTNSVKTGGTHIRSGGVFDETFLRSVEFSVWRDEQTHSPHWWSQASTSLSTHPGTSRGDYDPYTGILTAMGRNPQAALNYLAPLADYWGLTWADKVDNSKYKWLASRHWDQVSLEGLTAALAGASALRVPSSGYLDRHAAYLTEVAVNSLAGRGEGEYVVKDPQWNCVSRRNMSVLLANSIADVDNMARRNATTEGNIFESNLAAPWEKVREPELLALLQEVVKDDLALATLGAAAGDFSRRRVEAKAAETGSVDDATTIVQENNCLAGYILGAAEKGRKAEAAERDAMAGLFFSAFSDALSFLPSPQSKVAAKVVSLGTRYALQAGQEAFTSNVPSINVDKMGEVMTVQNKVAAFNALAQRGGAIPDPAYQNVNGNPYHYSWLRGRMIDASQFQPGTDRKSRDQFDKNEKDLNGFFGDTQMPKWAASETVFNSAFSQGHERGLKSPSEVEQGQQNNEEDQS